MKLYYYKAPEGNFGDDLNPWLWRHFLPNFFDDNDDQLFVGVGTLLDQRLPKVKSTIVFGSGARGGDIPAVYKGWDFCCVRGPLTAKKFNLDRNTAITDPAVLSSLVFRSDKKKLHRFSYMPHYMGAKLGNWKRVCQMIGIHYIDPRGSSLNVFEEIHQTEVLLTEAMHGAILADSFRVPWVPVKSYDFITDFKWMDWQASVNLDIPFQRLSSIWVGEKGQGVRVKINNSVKRTLLKMGVWFDTWDSPYPTRSRKKDIDRTCFELNSIVEKCSPVLSSSDKLSSNIERLLLKLEYVKKKYGS